MSVFNFFNFLKVLKLNIEVFNLKFQRNILGFKIKFGCHVFISTVWEY